MPRTEPGFRSLVGDARRDLREDRERCARDDERVRPGRAERDEPPGALERGTDDGGDLHRGADGRRDEVGAERLTGPARAGAERGDRVGARVVVVDDSVGVREGGHGLLPASGFVIRAPLARTLADAVSLLLRRLARARLDELRGGLRGLGLQALAGGALLALADLRLGAGAGLGGHARALLGHLPALVLLELPPPGG